MKKHFNFGECVFVYFLLIFLVISLSSVLAKNKEIIGDMLNKAHPTPMGRVLNTTCCRNIPREAIDREIDNTESSSINQKFFS